MCLIVFAYDAHPNYRFVLAANRDEFYERPTAPAQFWDDEPDVLGGRDLRGGGTWMGVTRRGRMAAITNVREPDRHREGAPSRGQLVARFLSGERSPVAYLRGVEAQGDRYNGFNLIAGDVGAEDGELAYYSNRDVAPRALTPGLYGVSNHVLGTPWPKVVRAREKLRVALEADVIDEDALLDALVDTEPAPDEALPDTGVGLEWERTLSPLFITSPAYGTRAATVLLVGRGGEVVFAEHSFGPGIDDAGTRRFQWNLASGVGGRAS